MRNQVHCSTVRKCHPIVSPPQLSTGRASVAFRGAIPTCCRGSEVRSCATGRRLEICTAQGMLKFLGAYALAKLLGFGLLGAIVIYLLIR